MATEHHFNIADAVKYGVESATILYNLRFWLEKNIANKHNIHDDRVWTYNSQDAFGIIFPYLTRRQIQKNLKKLSDDGILLKGNYNKNRFDNTAWYSINEPEFEAKNYTTKNGETELQATETRQHDMVLSAARYGAIDSTKRCYVTDNKQQIINTDSSSKKPAKAGFDCSLILIWILTEMRNAGYDVDGLNKSFIQASFDEYVKGAEKPAKSRALSWVETALKQKQSIERRSMKNGQARDAVNDAVVNHLQAQATSRNQKALAIAPRTTEQKLSDRSWDEPLG